MKRSLYTELVRWKDQPSRRPLIVRGARQVGKSFLVEQFGRQEFDSLHVLNFERQPELKGCFDSLDPKQIVKQIELLTGKRIKSGTSLLFFDEIQDAPQALKSLRYFAEEMPELHVIAAGSLLEFVLEDKNFSFPVGRVQIMNLGPLTFLEYLRACDQSPLVELIESVEKPEEISKEVHTTLLKFVQEYFRVGGMPGVVLTFLQTHSFLEAQRAQAAILDLYALDFGKYATRYAEHSHLKKLFARAPDLVGKHFKFSKIDPECANPARDYKEALNRLRQARLLLPVHATLGNGLPLSAEKNEKKFKIFLLDVGLLVMGTSWEKSSPKFRGFTAEQFVAQELTSIQDPFIEKGLFYWENPKKGSSAEIDFLINLDHKMVPIEVKSGSIGKLKSLRLFMEAKNTPLGIRISELPLNSKNNILTIPFYLISQLSRFVY